MVQRQQPAQSGGTNHASATPWFWQVLGVAIFICFGVASEGLACHTVSLSPIGLTYNAVLGATNPPNQTITVSRTYTSQTTVTASDNATWLSESPASTSMTTSTKLTAAVKTSGLTTAGTYNTSITIKVGSWCSYTAPVTLMVSPSPTPTTTATTKSATLAWDAVTGATITGYKVYVGEAPGQYSRTVTVGNVTSSTVSSLTVGRMYYFVVTAYNSAGESTPSNMVSKTIQ